MSVSLKNLKCWSAPGEHYWIYFGYCGIYCSVCGKIYFDELKDKPKTIRERLIDGNKQD